MVGRMGMGIGRVGVVVAVVKEDLVHLVDNAVLGVFVIPEKGQD
jgi:hypothetical protein